MLDSGIVAVWSTPEQFLAFQKAEIQKWAKVIKDANIRIE
jgi:tripartite-type tricarboxylate transporter receptor subunit TctC